MMARTGGILKHWAAPWMQMRPAWYNELKILLQKKIQSISHNGKNQWQILPGDCIPVNAVNDILQRASDSSLSTDERKRMITALAFINDKTAATCDACKLQNQICRMLKNRLLTGFRSGKVMIGSICLTGRK